MIVGHVSQQLMLDLLKKIAYLLELLDIFLVSLDELCPFLWHCGCFAWGLRICRFRLFLSLIQHFTYSPCSNWKLLLYSYLFKALIKPFLRKERHLLLIVGNLFQICLHSLRSKLLVRIVCLIIEMEGVFHFFDILIHSGMQWPICFCTIF